MAAEDGEWEDFETKITDIMVNDMTVERIIDDSIGRAWFSVGILRDLRQNFFDSDTTFEFLMNAGYVAKTDVLLFVGFWNDDYAVLIAYNKSGNETLIRRTRLDGTEGKELIKQELNMFCGEEVYLNDLSIMLSAVQFLAQE